MTATIWLNGSFVAREHAHVSVLDGGWLHGAGLFETLWCQHGTAFRLQAHLDRLRRSAAAILAPLEESFLPTAAVVHELMERAGLDSGRLRLTVSAGPMAESDGSDPPRPTVCLTASPAAGYPPEYFERGIQVAVCDYRVSSTDPVAGHKTTSYLPRLLGLRFAQEKRCPEALWFNTKNQLAEGSISNVFVVRNGSLATPPLDTPVLPGIARGVVLELAGRLALPAEQTPLSIDDLLDADEVFLTNAIMRVMPVIRVERHDISDARVGPVTRRLRTAFLETAERELTHS